MSLLKGETVVGVGQYFVASGEEKLICLGLGSCLGIVIHDPVKKCGALSHAMLPDFAEGRDKETPGKYVDTAIYLMVDELIERGSSKKNLVAKIFGGAQMFSYLPNNKLDIGSRNIASAKDCLKKEGITIIAEEVGGTSGRTIEYEARTGTVIIRKRNENKQY